LRLKADSLLATEEARKRRFGLTDFEWAIEPVLPTDPRGFARVDDRWVLNGMFWRRRTGAPWRDVPERYGPHTTRSNLFRRWPKAACETDLWKRCHAVEHVGGAPALVTLPFG
jgi:transposase